MTLLESIRRKQIGKLSPLEWLIAHANENLAEKAAAELEILQHDYAEAVKANAAVGSINADLIALLSDLEWCANADGDCLGHCPSCGASAFENGLATYKHNKDCKLAAALRGKP